MIDIKTLKENFTTQLKSVEDQIKTLESDLEKAKEYKFKVQGGLETLALLEDDGRQNPPAPEEAPTETTSTEVVE